MVAPVIPIKWKGFSVRRVFQGVRYDITVKRIGEGNQVRLTVDGKMIDGNVIPKPAAGVTKVTVEAVLS
jgi:cellobiose phosphorylase